MTSKFQSVALLARKSNPDNIATLQAVIACLEDYQLTIIIEQETAKLLPEINWPVVPREQLGNQCDLFIVVGGDGSLLNAARCAADCQKPVLGVNRGRLGFLTDVHPDEFASKFKEVLAGDYLEEQRFLLDAHISQPSESIYFDSALNEVALLPGDVAHMIEFSILIDDQFVCSQRADGLIVATPTGSTAYALSGGGPILHPQLNALVLVPICPHTLSSRPLVVGGDSEIKLIVDKHRYKAPQLSCDGHIRRSVQTGETIVIRKKPQTLRLIHPLDYNYFDTLRTKLHWENTGIIKQC
ncbi:MAG: ppnK [Gammaproteobacteria bacterium]|jgi:NAD+ kinase|nr:ppnK [Gammaproteobacteria bacterium]